MDSQMDTSSEKTNSDGAAQPKAQEIQVPLQQRQQHQNKMNKWGGNYKPRDANGAARKLNTPPRAASP